jgi:hypothetical protein
MKFIILWESLKFPLFFSKKMESIRSTTTDRLLIKTRISDDTLPSKHSCSNSLFNRSTSSRKLVLSSVAMAITIPQPIDLN